MSSWNPDHGLLDSDSDSDSEEPLRQYSGREAILFVVDAHLNQAADDRLLEALCTIRSALLSGLVINDKDLLGVVFESTLRNPLPLEEDCLNELVLPEHCAVFLPPRQLSKAIAEHFLNFLDTFSKDSFAQKYGWNESGDGSSFVYMLRLCRDLVRICNYPVDHITIVYLTDRCTPFRPESDEYHRAMYKAADLKDEDIDFQVIPMIDDFDYDIFYREFLSLVWGESMDSFAPISPERLREIMADRKIKQHFNGRSLGHFKFTLGPDVVISAQYFSYFQRDKGPRKILLQRTNNAIVRRKLRSVIHKEDEQTGDLEIQRTVNVTNAWYEIKVGNEVINFSNEQVNRIRNLHAPGMMLLGFKPQSCLDDVLHVNPCKFMYPDNSHIIGSRKLFRALWERCRIRKMVPICLFMCKRKSKPCYVALMPVARSDVDSNSHYSLLSNDGFKIMYLPFADNLRRVNFSAWNALKNHATDEALEVCEKVVRKFRLKYNPSILCDPNLNQLSTKLLALAFDVKFETLGSQYFPDAQVQEELLANVIEKFKAAFHVDSEPKSEKRRKPATTAKSRAKKAKCIDNDDNNNDDDQQ